MRIAIIIGSHRKDSQSGKIGRFLQGQIESLGNHDCWTCDLGKDPLPLWDEDIGSDAPHWAAVPALNERLGHSDAFIVIAPEWHGMVPATLKNFFLVCGGGGTVAHKPALAVGVSVGPGGSYPINELRTSSSEIYEHLWKQFIMSQIEDKKASNQQKVTEFFDGYVEDFFAIYDKETPLARTLNRTLRRSMYRRFG